MEIILMKDVPTLGQFGDVISVKDGYARNYLIPKGLARPSTEANLKIIELHKKKLEQKLKQEKAEAVELGKKISSVSCTIPVKVGEGDRLFGSVTADMIQKALEAEGVVLDKRQIVLDGSIKKMGIYNIPVTLHPEVTVECKVWVVKE